MRDHVGVVRPRTAIVQTVGAWVFLLLWAASTRSVAAQTVSGPRPPAFAATYDTYVRRIDTLVPATVHVALELHIEDATTATGPGLVIGRQRGDGVVLVPLVAMLRAAGIRATSTARAVTAPGAATRPGFTLQFRERRLRRLRRTERLSTSDIEVESGVDGPLVLVSTPLLARLLGVVVVVDLVNASMQLRQTGALPVVQQVLLRRAALRGLGDTSTRHVIVRDSVSAREQTHSILQLDYAVQAHQTLPLGPQSASNPTWSSRPMQLAARVHASARVAGGVLMTNIQPSGGGPLLDGTSWLYRPRSITRSMILQLGTIDDVGAAGSRVYGVMFGSPPRDPFSRRVVRMGGDRHADWSYVAVANGVYVPMAYDSAGGYQVDVPVYGDASQIDVMGWGPDGISRRVSRMVHAPAEMLGAGMVRYAGSAGLCAPLVDALRVAERRCRWQGSTDWRFGVSRAFTLQTGFSLTDQHQSPYVGGHGVFLSSLVLDGLTTVGAGAASAAHWQATWNPVPGRLVALSGRAIGESTVQSAQAQVALPGREQRVSLVGWWTRASTSRTRVDLGRVGVVAQARGLRTELFGTAMHSPGSTRRETGTGVELSVLPASMSRWWLRVAASRLHVADGMARIATAHQWRGELRLNGRLLNAEIEIGRTINGGGAPSRWLLSVSPRLPQVRLITAVSSTETRATVGNTAPERESAVTQYASGTLLIDPSQRRITASQEHSTDRGQLRARVFLDLNGNGRRDDREHGLGDVTILAGNRRAVTDAAGQARLGALTSAEPVRVQLDSTSIAMPCWTPSRSAWRVQVPAAGLVEIDLPVRYGTILDGRLATPVEGATSVRIVARNGTASFETPLLSDGTFYAMGVPAGSYRLTVTSPPATGRPQTLMADIEIAAPQSAALPTSCVVLRVTLGSTQ